MTEQELIALEERAMEMTENKTQWTEASNGAAANASEDGWNAVTEEVQIVLENIGDGWIGTLVRMDERVGVNNLTQAHFENVTYVNGDELAPRAFINCPRDLINKLRTVPLRRQVRAIWTSELSTGQQTPMRVFTVAWR